MSLYLYNTLSGKKEKFKPWIDGKVGLYVCGPTVYAHSHLGHARSAITFDILYRYLLVKGYQVRYVRNITDIGHLLDENTSNEDKILNRAKLERIEPMEVVQNYTNSYRDDMDTLKLKRPSIEPTATGHIIDQIEAIEHIIKEGYGYPVNGSVYFDIKKYEKNFSYGVLSGRKIEELMVGEGNKKRKLEGSSEKKNSHDFALWKKAASNRLMSWNSPWGRGLPGWHIECSVMSNKYFFNKVDIHGGGLDLLFPHHECELAQNCILNKAQTVKYWIHNNLITIQGNKMSKSLNNFVLIKDFFNPSNAVLKKGFSPMVLKFFNLQAHYRSTLDFSTTAIQAAEKGFNRLKRLVASLKNIPETPTDNFSLDDFQNKCHQAMDNDLNTAELIALFFGLEKIKNKGLREKSKKRLLAFTSQVMQEWLGLYWQADSDENKREKSNENIASIKVIDNILKLRNDLKREKNYLVSDKIRDTLIDAGLKIKDENQNTTWEF